MTNFQIKSTLIIIICVISLSALAKEKFEPGYIVNQKGDTTQGFIAYKEWKINPQSINFKTELGNETNTLSNEDIVGFGVKEEVFRSVTVEIEWSHYKITNDLDDSPELEITKERTFLRAIYLGKKSLWSNTNSDYIENFYIQEGQSYQLLVYKRYTAFAYSTYTNDVTTIKENNKYIGQIMYYLSECPEIQKIASDISYDGRVLYKVFKNYADCASPDYSYEKEKNGAFEFNAIAGITMIYLNLHMYPIGNQKYKSTDFTTGIGFDYVFFKNNGRWSWNNELLYSFYFVEGDFDNEDFYGDYKFRIGYLKTNSLARIKFPISNFHVYVNTGISIGVIVHENEKINYTNKQSGYTYDNDDPITPRNIEHGLVLGLGAKRKNLSFEVRFERSNGVSYETKPRRFNFMLGYRFN